MPDSLINTKNAKTQGTGTYQVGTAPKTLKQKAKEQQQINQTRIAATSKQKVKSYAPGSDPRIKGRTSFSDQRGD